MTFLRLNLGCGRDIREGWVNSDFIQGPGVDVVADLEKRLPWDDNTFYEILISHTLEHLGRRRSE